jgi:hypothetical protein
MNYLVVGCGGFGGGCCEYENDAKVVLPVVESVAIAAMSLVAFVVMLILQ